MKNILFVLFLLLAVYYLFKVLKILLYDFQRLTEYGAGYLVGLTLLCVLFAGLATLVKLKWRSKKE